MCGLCVRVVCANANVPDAKTPLKPQISCCCVRTYACVFVCACVQLCANINIPDARRGYSAPHFKPHISCCCVRPCACVFVCACVHLCANCTGCKARILSAPFQTTYLLLMRSETSGDVTSSCVMMQNGAITTA